MKIKNLILAALAVVTTLTSCSNDESSASGKMVVRVTDAPFQYDLVKETNVTITKIEGRSENKDSESSYVTLTEKEATINLLELNNGLTETLADIEIPSGSYNLFRIYIKDASVVLKDGTVYNLKVPSGAQSGLKVFVDPFITVGEGTTGEILLDFDISKSFVAQGNPNSTNGITGFIFKPVIKASNSSTSSSLSGTVTGESFEFGTAPIALEGAQISVFAADTLNTTTFTNADGTYKVMGLSAGTYTVTAEANFYTMETAENVTITSGVDAIQDFLLKLPQEN
ncbi:DUF4382 domain-containing protein [Aquimarina intermedia]|nr:DUF4382 domain-containing protein [Aquimarina intermedia]